MQVPVAANVLGVGVGAVATIGATSVDGATTVEFLLVAVADRLFSERNVFVSVLVSVYVSVLSADEFALIVI